MPRKNHRHGRPQATRRADGSAGRRRPAAPPIERMVIPKGRCFFRNRKGKLIFTKDEVAKALVQAKKSRESKGATYAESRAYECPPGGCGGWHLTSRTGPWVERKSA